MQFGLRVSHGAGLRLMSASAAVPHTSTATSMRTEITCTRSNEARKVLVAGVASTEPTVAYHLGAQGFHRSRVTQNCDTNVSAIIANTSSGAWTCTSAAELRSATAVTIR